jgi:signal transduction histidine kinase
VASDDRFARFVSLACHDLRTPLATVAGFAHTLNSLEQLGDAAERYVGMILAGTEQLTEILDDLGLVARIESGRYAPALMDADTLELATAAAASLEDRVDVEGTGATVRVDPGPTERALAALARGALRHGGLERVSLRAQGVDLFVEPVNADAAPVVLAQELKDLGSATAIRVVEALGGTVELEGETLHIRLVAANT